MTAIKAGTPSLLDRLTGKACREAARVSERGISATVPVPRSYPLLYIRARMAEPIGIADITWSAAGADGGVGLTIIVTRTFKAIGLVAYFRLDVLNLRQ
jgi:hypothetical protein